jgi:hypothetical protein
MNGCKYKKNMDLMTKIKEINKMQMNKIKTKTIGNCHLKKI